MTTPDRTFYMIKCFHSGEFYFPERLQQDTHLQETIADIESGQVPWVYAVYAFNPATGHCSDASKTVAKGVLDLVAEKNSEMSHDLRTFVHIYLGVGACP